MSFFCATQAKAWAMFSGPYGPPLSAFGARSRGREERSAFFGPQGLGNLAQALAWVACTQPS
jgi:hypothetical protein